MPLIQAFDLKIPDDDDVIVYNWRETCLMQLLGNVSTGQLWAQFPDGSGVKHEESE